MKYEAPAPTDNVVWAKIPDFPGYEASNEGHIRSTKFSTPRIMKTPLNDQGYPVVALRREGRYVHRKVHTFIALTFIGPGKPGEEVCHQDGNKLNNHLFNLEWGTSSENNYDQVRHGTHYEANRIACDKGHDYTPENTMWRWGKGGKAGGKRYRKCRTCHYDAQTAQALKKRPCPDCGASPLTNHKIWCSH